MIGISRLYCDVPEASDPLRYKRPANMGPVVVFNCTPACNLRCEHCYSSTPEKTGVMSTDQVKTMFDDLKAAGCPSLLLSGGEPLLREDLPELLTHAASIGLRIVLSTNGTRLDEAWAKRLAEASVGYVGISLDAAEAKIHDAFRGKAGCFDAALTGIKHARDAGLKTGLRFTMHSENLDQIPGIFDLIEASGINRVCFYHLVPAGRGKAISNRLPSPAAIRETLDIILQRTRRAHEQNKPLEVLTVGNHADGAYLFLKLQAENPAHAGNVLKLLQHSGGNRSGEKIGCINWDGEVYPDQFWRNHPVGNVQENPFSEIWSSPQTPLLSELRDRKSHLTCRCMRCRFLDICNGNLRARAEAMGNGPWGEDPGCYLTDEEIAP